MDLAPDGFVPENAGIAYCKELIGLTAANTAASTTCACQEDRGGKAAIRLGHFPGRINEMKE